MAKSTPKAKQAKELRPDPPLQGRTLPDWLAAILNPKTVSHERLPMLEVIFERVTRTLSTNLRNLTSDNVDITMEEMVSLRFGEHLETISDQSLIGVFSSTALEGSGLLIADAPLIQSIVNVFLGGRRIQETSKFERSYTTIERNLVKRLFRLLLDELETSIEPLIPAKFSIDRLETSPRFATIVRPENPSVLVGFKIQMEGKKGEISLLIPYSSLQAIRPMLLEMFLGEKIGHDLLWEHHISKELLETEVTLDVVLDQLTVDLGSVLDWKKGSSFALNITPDSLIDVRCGEHRLLKGKMGQKNGKVAVFIDEDLFNHQEEKEHV